MTAACPNCGESRYLERMPDGDIKCDNCSEVWTDDDLGIRED